MSPVSSPKFRSIGKRQSSSSVQYFKPGTTLTEHEQSYCRCVLHVAAEQPGKCDFERAWFQHMDGKTCANPYAVCAHSTHTSTRHCSENYNFENIPDDELEAYANLHKINVSPYNRALVLQKISALKSMGK
jgi:hypothetical protein